ncbi:MAG: tannase/feruloyl esterase family alpha/beta hydrolase [Gemmatimonadota bacterium]|jgi:feruloyl esterase
MRFRSRPVPKLTCLVSVVLVSAAAIPPESSPLYEIGCADLARSQWAGFRIDSSELVDADDTNPRHCRVEGTIDTEIHFELLLPLENDWNGRFVMGGGGGFVGSVTNQAMSGLAGQATPLGQGYATVGTDTGHQGGTVDASWALNHPDREVNFGHRAVHVTAEAAKTIMRIHYGRDLDYSYFVGCSRGGGQGMMESQRYPDDFDGIVAGAPAYNWTAIGALGVQAAQAVYPNPRDPSARNLDPDALRLLSSAVMEACDDLDGVADGILNDPTQCAFRTEDLPRCTGTGGAVGCLTDAQLTAIRVVYRGPMVDGHVIYPGYPIGNEAEPAGWALWLGGGGGAGPGLPSLHFGFGTQMYKYIVFDDPDWDYSTYDFSNWEHDTRRAAKMLNATDTDLTAFRTAGGKLILWNGWSDPALTAYGTIQYYDDLVEGDPGAHDYARLFLLPGVLHCNGGPGPDQVEWLETIRRWVEEGQAPTRVTATKRTRDGAVDMQRPLCAYPLVARYDGGDPKREESFTCAAD